MRRFVVPVDGYSCDGCGLVVQSDVELFVSRQHTIWYMDNCLLDNLNMNIICTVVIVTRLVVHVAGVSDVRLRPVWGLLCVCMPREVK